MAWDTYICKISDKLAQVLINSSFENKAPVKELPLLFWVGVYCQMPTNQCFHNLKETQKLDEIEDNLIKLCDDMGMDGLYIPIE